MIKVDCVKVSGRVDYVTMTNRMTNGLKANVSIDGNLLPNIQMETELFEELNAGDEVTLYVISRNSGKKLNNDAVLYGYEKAGAKVFVAKYRWQVPLFLTFYAAIAFCVVFAVGWPLSAYLVIYLHLAAGGASLITTLALVEACLAGGFFLHAAWRVISSTTEPEAWSVMDAATLSSRFSKIYK